GTRSPSRPASVIRTKRDLEERARVRDPRQPHITGRSRGSRRSPPCPFVTGANAPTLRQHSGRCSHEAIFGAQLFVANVEWPGGLSPPGSPRTVREPLDSYGSRCSAIDQPPFHNRKLETRCRLQGPQGSRAPS